MMFLVGYISCPPTMGFFIPATAEVTAMATIANTTASFLFMIVILIVGELGFLTLSNSTERLSNRIYPDCGLVERAWFAFARRKA
jgi:hypothetical protein